MSVSMVPSVLDAVTVYAQGALCTRVATVKPEGGKWPTRVRIGQLPVSLRTGSLRAFVRKGPAGLSVRDVRAEWAVVTPDEVDVPAQTLAVEAAEARHEAVLAEVQRLQQRAQLLKNLRPTEWHPKEGELPKPSSLSSLLELAAFAENELEPVQRELLAKEEELKEAAEDLNEKRRRLQEASSSVRSQRTVVQRAAVLTLSEGAGEETIELVLEYAINGARWAPAYDLTLSRALDSGSLQLRANLMQRTGEDWTQVKLSLSTANLDRRAIAPELKSLRIGRRQPPPARSGWRETPPGLEELFSDYQRVRPPPVTTPSSTVTAGYDSENMPYAVAGPQGGPVPADGLRSEATATRAAMLKGGMPPPPPKTARPPLMAAAAPMPPPAPMAQAAPGGVISGKLRAKASAPARETMKKDVAYADDAAPEMAEEAAFGGAVDQLEGGLVSAAGMEPEATLLDYDALELAGPEEPGRRGKLRPPAAGYEFAMLAAMRVDVHIATTMIAIAHRQAAEVESAPPPAFSVPPRHAAGFFDYRYDVAARVDVPSDSSWHSIPVLKAEVALAAEYVTVPSIEPQVFRTVKVDNRTAHALLAGPVDVRLGEEFLMTSPMPTLAPGATQRIGLGVEEAIKVSRNTRFDEATGGVFGGSTVLAHGVEIEVANRLGHPATVEVRDRVPAIPQGEKDIKLEETEVSPPWSRPTVLPGEVPVEGERSWRVNLKPGETQKLKASWSVKIPASKMLSGGNRRA